MNRSFWLSLLFICTTALGSTQSWAFDLDQLSERLTASEVVRGPFIQEKHLRALPQPLSSSGNFTLSREHGLLWHLQKPIDQHYRIGTKGIERNTQQGWQAQGQQNAATRYSRLFLQVLQGESDALQRDFDLTLSGEPNAWMLRLVPKGIMLQKIFTEIRVSGALSVEKIEIIEQQGDRTLFRLTDNQLDDTLSPEEQRDFAP